MKILGVRAYWIFYLMALASVAMPISSSNIILRYNLATRQE